MTGRKPTFQLFFHPNIFMKSFECLSSTAGHRGQNTSTKPRRELASRMLLYVRCTSSSHICTSLVTSAEIQSVKIGGKELRKKRGKFFVCRSSTVCFCFWNVSCRLRGDQRLPDTDLRSLKPPRVFPACAELIFHFTILQAKRESGSSILPSPRFRGGGLFKS